MLGFLICSPRPLRVLGVVAALLIGSIVAGERAEAMSPLNPGMPVAGKAAVNGLTIEVRGGHGGGGGGGHFGGGGGMSRGFTGGAFNGAVVRGGAIGAGAAAVAGGPRYAGHPFFHHHHHFHGVFIGGVYYDDYPYDYYPDYYDYPPAYPVATYVAGGDCHRVLTAYGPRVVCHHWAARHHRRTHWHHHHRRHHHA